MCDEHNWFGGHGVNEPGPDCQEGFCSGCVPLYPGDSTYWCDRQITIEAPEVHFDDPPIVDPDMKKALREMHETVVDTLVEAIRLLPKPDRETLAAYCKAKAKAIHDDARGLYVEGNMANLSGSPIGLKVAALEDLTKKIEAI